MKSPALLAAELRKAEAEAHAAEAAARKADLETAKLQKENEEWEAAKEDRRRETEVLAEEKQLANDEKRLANLNTQKSWITDAVPDLKDVDRGKTTGADKPLFTALLAIRSLNKAAREVALNLLPPGTSIQTLLLTTDDTLVDRLAVYDGVMRHLDMLLLQVTAANDTVPPAPDEGGTDTDDSTSPGAESAGIVAAGAAAALAKLVPGVLGLVSANRTVASGDVPQDAYVTLLAVAGQIRSWDDPPPLLIDETRLLQGATQVEKKFAELELNCHDLSVSLAQSMGRTDETFVKWAKGSKATLDLAQAAMSALSTVVAGSSISPLMAAAQQAVFADQNVSHVVVIKPAGASTSQLVDDRPLTMKDPVHIVTTAAIAYATIDRATSHVIGAGVRTGESSLIGKIGSRFEFDPPPGTRQ